MHLQTGSRNLAVATLTAAVSLAAPLLGLPNNGRAGDAVPAAQAEDARIWIGRAAEMEDYLRTAEVVKMEDLSVGVTKPRRARLAPGGPFESFAWKAIRPGRYDGYRESYLAEIAAYELDKVLELNMVPPTVLREYNREKGAAVMWVSPTKSFGELGGVPTPPTDKAALWNRQIVKAKMFDNLIYNQDPNLGNWLVDPAWNLILIDHTRAFQGGRTMVHELTRVDEDLWNRMRALTEDSLKAALQPGLSNGEVRSVIQRRDKMQEIVDKLVKERGEAYVFMRQGGSPR
jgi:hypothetical protein